MQFGIDRLTRSVKNAERVMRMAQVNQCATEAQRDSVRRGLKVRSYHDKLDTGVWPLSRIVSVNGPIRV